MIVPWNINKKSTRTKHKKLAEALRQYGDTTRNEIENIKNQISLKFQMAEIEQKKEIANSFEK